MNAQESGLLFKRNEPIIWCLRDEVKEIIGIELYSDAVTNYANEALKLNQNQIDTEHLLLGLIREGRGIAVSGQHKSSELPFTTSVLFL